MADLIFLKKTTSIRPIEEYTTSHDNENFMSEMRSIRDQMIAEGKTDGAAWIREIPGNQMEVTRKWVDQSSADEWVVKWVAVLEKYQLSYISIVVDDIGSLVF